jgi:hypothetical protein
VTLHDLTIENGGFADIYNGGTVKLTDSTVSGGGGYGIDNNGTMTIIDGTIANNTAVTNAPATGIYNQMTMTIIASTISGNNGGLSSPLGTKLTLGATIVAGNAGANCTGAPGTLVSAGYNLTNSRSRTLCGFSNTHDRVNKHPGLGPLANNGGPTKTLAPAAGGPADDAISKTTTLRGVTVCPGTDQRGIARPAKHDTHCTIGAVEV